jgi:hypothetical protein
MHDRFSDVSKVISDYKDFSEVESALSAALLLSTPRLGSNFNSNGGSRRRNEASKPGPTAASQAQV